MEQPSRRGWVCDWLWWLLWGIASSAWCWGAARALGATFDEPVYIRRGLEVWRTGSHRGLLQLGTMPLPADVQTLPLYLWERWQGLRLDPVGDLEVLLPWARTATLVFWWLLLIYARLAGRHLAGAWGGRLAVAFVACEPVLLAHASLATTDMAVTACLLALVYHYRSGRDADWFRRIALPAGWFAATLLAKASGLVFGPICLCVVELEYLVSKTGGGKLLKGRGGEAVKGQESAAARSPAWSSGPASKRELTASARRLGLLLRPFARDFAQIMTLGLLLTFVYCGSDWQTDPSFREWAGRLPDGTISRALAWLAEHLRIFSNAGEGLVRQVKHNVRGHGTYLLGRVADRAIWYYFPVALTIKLSISLLMLPVLLAVLRPRALANWACLAALALLAFSVTYRVQIGIRLVLPLVVLGIVGLAAAAVQACAALRGTGKPTGRPSVKEWESAENGAQSADSRALARAGASAGLRLPGFVLAPSYALPLFLSAALVWNTLTAVWVWPHGLCYTNELWGGTRHGYLCLSDSNYDWGQGLKELARWQQRHRQRPLAVWYFGSDPSLASLPMQAIRFDALALTGPEQVLALVRGRYLAVSTTLLYGSVESALRSNPPALASYEQVREVLHGRRPVDRTTTFLIYDFTAAP